MADTKKHIRVFLASPGDLQDERSAAKAIVDHINKMFSDFESYHVDLVGWEDTLPQYGRAQAVINQDLETCELFVGMLWERWGTPPNVDGPYTSGFEEEYQIAITSRRESGRPEIFLFLKDVDPKLVRDPGEDTKKILAFRDDLIAAKEIKYEKFKDVRDFEFKFMQAVVSYVQKLAKEDREKQRGDNKAGPAESSSAVQVQHQPGSDSPLSSEGASFLREFLSRVEKDRWQESVGSVDIARFRLLSSIISTQINDEGLLGVHDANLLYEHKEDLNFGNKEISGLIRTALYYYKSEHVPLWHWYAQQDGFDKRALGLRAVGSSANVEAGALYAMAAIEEPLPEVLDSSRDSILGVWLGEGSESQVKVAALNYLGECGLPSDLKKIEEEFDRGNYQTRSAALEAIVRINLRQGRQRALSGLFDLQVDQISDHLLKTLFEHLETVSSETLLEGVSQRNAAIRRGCVAELISRKKLNAETAEALLEDGDADVRLLAITELSRLGRKYSLEEGRKILVRKTSGAFLGAPGMSVGDSQYEEYQKLFYASRTEHELEELAKRASIYDRRAECALLEKRFYKDSATLFSLIEDRYTQVFESKLAEMVSLYGEDSQLVKDTARLGEFTRNGFVRDALDIVLRKSDATGLPFVRMHLANDSMAYSDCDLEYLKKYGEWQDVPLIVSLVYRYKRGESLLSIGNGKKYRLAAAALHRIGKKRIGELLQTAMPAELLARLIRDLSDREYRSLSSEQIRRLLLSEAENVRKVSALKCVHSFSKKRLNDILRDYIDSEAHRYYNVVHWLDLGVSASREVAHRSAAKIMLREW